MVPTGFVPDLTGFVPDPMVANLKFEQIGSVWEIPGRSVWITGRSHAHAGSYGLKYVYEKDRFGSSWDRSGVMVMNKVWGAGSPVLHLPYIIATRFITRWFRAHWDCMLWGESTFTPSHFQRRAPPFTCMYKWSSREIPVGKEGARSVVHLYRSVDVLVPVSYTHLTLPTKRIV